MAVGRLSESDSKCGPHLPAITFGADFVVLTAKHHAHEPPRVIVQSPVVVIAAEFVQIDV